MKNTYEKYEIMMTTSVNVSVNIERERERERDVKYHLRETHTAISAKEIRRSFRRCVGQGICEFKAIGDFSKVHSSD